MWAAIKDLLVIVQISHHLRAVFRAGQRRQQQGCENGNDGYNDQQLDEGKSQGHPFIPALQHFYKIGFAPNQDIGCKDLVFPSERLRRKLEGQQ